MSPLAPHCEILSFNLFFFVFLLATTSQAKNSRMSPFTKWAYLAVQPFLDDAGISTIELQQGDFNQFSSTPGLAEEAGFISLQVVPPKKTTNYFLLSPIEPH